MLTRIAVSASCSREVEVRDLYALEGSPDQPGEVQTTCVSSIL